MNFIVDTLGDMVEASRKSSSGSEPESQETESSETSEENGY
jgi:hypothetical protein